MKPHMWVALIVMPVEAELVMSGRVEVSHTEMAEELAKDDARVACWTCDAVLGPSTVDTECPGSEPEMMP